MRELLTYGRRSFLGCTQREIVLLDRVRLAELDF